ncbi:MAG: CoA transferase [Dehalococcoidia bacterium]|nr:CoA transferase [Dehalococcoidia bacterium]
MASGPLSGIQVLEFTQIIAGPFCGLHLADMGADVIKFEPIEGEPWRLFSELVPKESRTFASLNRGKRGVAMDMTRPEAQEAIHRLARNADVVVINYRPGVADQLKIDYTTLSAINPRIIYCENTAFGRQGPLAQRGGYDIVVQALTGLMAGEGKMLGDVPTFIYPAVADYATGIQMANSISAALFHRERTGEGQRIDCTLMGTALAMQTSQFTCIDAWDAEVFPPMLEEIRAARLRKESFAEQVEIHRKYRPVAPGNIYYRVFQTADGFIAMGALSDALRRKVLAATGLHDPRFKEDGTFELAPEGWEERGPELVAEAEALYRTKTTEEWGKLFEAHGVPAGPMHFIEELLGHPQTIANGLEVTVEHELLGPMRMVGPAFQMSASPLAAQGGAHCLAPIRNRFWRRRATSRRRSPGCASRALSVSAAVALARNASAGPTAGPGEGPWTFAHSTKFATHSTPGSRASCGRR